MSRWRVSNFLRSWLPVPSVSPVLISLVISDVTGLAGFARLCVGDQYEVRNPNSNSQTLILSEFPRSLRHFYCLLPCQVLMRYGRQRWRLRGRMEVSNKQMWDSEEYIFLPLITELLSIKVVKQLLVISSIVYHLSPFKIPKYAWVSLIFKTSSRKCLNQLNSKFMNICCFNDYSH